MDDLRVQSEAYLTRSKETQRVGRSSRSGAQYPSGALSTAAQNLYADLDQLTVAEVAEAISAQVDHQYLLDALFGLLEPMEPKVQSEIKEELALLLCLPAGTPVREFSTAQLAAALLLVD